MSCGIIITSAIEEEDEVDPFFTTTALRVIDRSKSGASFQLSKTECRTLGGMYRQHQIYRGRLTQTWPITPTLFGGARELQHFSEELPIREIFATQDRGDDMVLLLIYK
jgi:hypothetical protein